METKKTTTVAVMIALAIVLNIVSGIIPFFRMPKGGSVVLMSTMIIMFIGIKYGFRTGLLAGFVYGLINFMLSPFAMHPMALVLDYLLAFMVFGIGTLFIGRNVTLKKIIFAYFICSALRFLCSFVSGVIFYGEYAPVGQTVYYYSFIYNIMYILPEFAINSVILAVPSFKRVMFEKFLTEV